MAGSSRTDRPGRPGPAGERREVAAGFTLLEILVALAILGVSFTVLLGGHSAALRSEGRARRLMTATLLARQVLTQTEVDGVSDMGDESGDFGEDFPGYAWERQVGPVNLPLDLPPGFTLDDLREVHIRVTWPEGGETASTEVVYYTMVKTP